MAYMGLCACLIPKGDIFLYLRVNHENSCGKISEIYCLSIFKKHIFKKAVLELPREYKHSFITKKDVIWVHLYIKEPKFTQNFPTSTLFGGKHKFDRFYP